MTGGSRVPRGRSLLGLTGTKEIGAAALSADIRTRAYHRQHSSTTTRLHLIFAAKLYNEWGPPLSNDNALAEGKNAAVVRQYLGYAHIPRRFAPLLNAFNHNTLSPFLNYHRPWLFPTEDIDPKGRLRKRYRDADLATPYEKFKSLPDAARFLKPAATFAQLDAQAYALSDLKAANHVNQARSQLFRAIAKAQAAAA